MRIELFGDEVESMRWFSTFTQRSLGEAERVELAPAAELDAEHRELAELAAMEAAEQGGEPPSLADAAAAGALPGAARPGPRLRRGRPRRRRGDRAGAARPLGGRDDGDARRRRPPPLRRRRGAAGRARRPLADRRRRGRRGRLPRRPRRVARSQRQGGGGGAGEAGPLRLPHRRRLRQPRRGRARPLRARPPRRLPARRRPALAGPRPLPSPRRGCARASSAPSCGSRSTPSAASSTAAAAPTSRAAGAARGRLAFSDLRVGDYVVHEDHGVARFAGFETREVGGVTRDYLYLEYRGEDRVYVPTDQLAKLSRYVGAGGEPPLSALGGKRWQNMKARARNAAGALAGELLNLYAERRTRKGPRLPARRRVADRDGGGLPLPRDRRPDRGDRGGQGRHGVRAADGPAGLRRRRLRQDRGRAARRGQGRGRRQAGDDAGADDDPRPAALRHLPRAPRRPPLRGRGRLAAAQAGRGEGGAGGLRGGQGRRPDRHPPAALARRPRQATSASSSSTRSSASASSRRSCCAS